MLCGAFQENYFHFGHADTEVHLISSLGQPCERAQGTVVYIASCDFSFSLVVSFDQRLAEYSYSQFRIFSMGKLRLSKLHVPEHS